MDTLRRVCSAAEPVIHLIGVKHKIVSVDDASEVFIPAWCKDIFLAYVAGMVGKAG